MIGAEGAPLRYTLDDYDVSGFLRVAESFGQDRLGYVVTPNIDHFIFLHEDAAFREYYRHAAYVLLDSKLAAMLFLVLKRRRFAVCRGSDLTVALFHQSIRPGDNILVVGGQPAQIQMLQDRHPGVILRHYNPPMGFIRDTREVENLLEWVEASGPFRFCFVAVGAPRQEQVAAALMARGRARGLILCVGGAIDFMTGAQKRAPLWMQASGLEWLYRLIRQPRRLAHRYLVRGPRFFRYLLTDEFAVRPAVPIRADA